MFDRAYVNFIPYESISLHFWKITGPIWSDLKENCHFCACGTPFQGSWLAIIRRQLWWIMCKSNTFFAKIWAYCGVEMIETRQNKNIMGGPINVRSLALHGCKIICQKANLMQGLPSDVWKHNKLFVVQGWSPDPQWQAIKLIWHLAYFVVH